MDRTTYESIKDSALLLQDYAEIPGQLRAIAEFITEPKHKKKLQSIAKLLERDIPNTFFNPSKLTAYEILKLIQTKSYSDEELAPKVGKSASTVRQTIGALKAGGISITEEIARGYKVGSQGGRPMKGRAL